MRATAPVSLLVFAVVLSTNSVQAQIHQNVTSIRAKDLRRILTDRTFVTRQINCVLGKGPCDRLGGQLKRAIPEVLHRNCAGCTPDQASKARKLMNFIKNRYPSAYREVLHKFRRVTGKQPASTPVNPTNSQSTINATTYEEGIRTTKPPSVLSPPKGLTIETANEARTSSIQSQTKTSEAQSQGETSSVQSPQRATINTANQARTSTVQSQPKGVVLETARQVRVSAQ